MHDHLGVGVEGYEQGLPSRRPGVLDKSCEYVPVSEVDVTFSEPIALSTLTYEDVTLTRNGSAVTLTSAVTISAAFLDRAALHTSVEKDVMLALQFAMLGGGILLWFGHTSHYQLRMPFWMEIFPPADGFTSL